MSAGQSGVWNKRRGRHLPVQDNRFPQRSTTHSTELKSTRVTASNLEIMVSPVLACFLVLLNALLTAGEIGCPEPEDVAPCVCSRLPTVRLTCSGLLNPDDLRTVFGNSERYTFHQVHIVNSVMLTIPSEILKKVTVNELYLKNVTLRTIFSDLEVANYDIEKIHIERTVLISSLAGQDFTSFVSLKEIYVYNSSVSTLSRGLGKNLPKSIKIMVLSHTGTKAISKDALSLAENLDKLAVEHGKLKKISRDAFPRPFNGRILSFNDNKISAIPEDMFTDMPKLQFLSLMNNDISVIPETAFAGRSVNIAYLRLNGNPLECDCRLLWLIEDKPEVLGGTCSGPEGFTGRMLRDLEPAEISCSN